MNKKEFNISVSTKDNNAKIVQGIVQFDTGNLLNLYIRDGDRPFDFTGYTQAVIEVLNPDASVYVDADGGSLNVINPEYGLISFTLTSQCVKDTGMHYVAVNLYSNGTKITTARFNYYVSESMDAAADDVSQDSNYPILMQLISQVSNIIDAEQMRQAAEEIRQAAEQVRDSSTANLATEYNTLIGKLNDLYVLFNSAVTDNVNVDLSTVVTLTQLTEAIKAIDCGTFTSDSKTLQIIRGTNATMPALKPGQLAYSTDAKTLYIGTDGTAGGNTSLAPYIASSTAPSDTSKLWIDTANGNALKYYSGTAWVACNTAVFS